VPRYKLTIAYDGTDFCGWQKQEPLAPPADSPLPHVPAAMIAGTLHDDVEGTDRLQLRTVQHVVERAVVQIVRERVVLHGASRTDSGVHALGQVAAFSCSGDDEGPDAPRGAGWPLSRGVDRLRRAINGRLPEDVIVTAVEAVHADFNPIREAISKAYSYTLHTGRERPLWDRRFVHQVHDELDLEAMRRAASLLAGTHDFAAFAAAGHGRQSTVRTIFACDVTPVSSERLRIDVSGNGFLWNMVRIIAGTLVEVGRGRMKAESIPEIIASGRRERAGPTLPPTGLRLEWIRHGEP
jgi:tRNA pseudouridine38-40 synthase